MHSLKLVRILNGHIFTFGTEMELVCSGGSCISLSVKASSSRSLHQEPIYTHSCDCVTSFHVIFTFQVTLHGDCLRRRHFVVKVCCRHANPTRMKSANTCGPVRVEHPNTAILHYKRFSAAVSSEYLSSR